MSGIIKLDEVPNLDDYEIESVDLSYEYWSPAKEGEMRRLYFMAIEEMTVPDHNNPEKMVQLDCAVFLEIDSEGNHKTVVNGSVRLRSIVERLPQPTPVQITYLGKKKNRSNSNESGNWSVHTLAKKGGK